MEPDLKFTLPVIRNKSETPKIIQKYLPRSPLMGYYFGNIDTKMMIYF